MARTLNLKPVLFPVSIFIAAGSLLLSCNNGETITMNFTQTQLTSDPYGHTINTTQAFSKSGEWIVYDTRNDDTQIGSTGCIEMVNTKTRNTKVLYQTAHQTEYGPGVGAATFSPVKDRVIFIRGIRNADKSKPYSITRRTGVAIDIGTPEKPVFMDARDVSYPFTAGALRGGTHAHSWSGDGNWISFTYNDYVMEQLSKSDTSVKDLRMVGVMVPGKVTVEEDSTQENNSGEMFAMVVTRVTENPEPGSNEIDKAFDECWIGSGGYIRSDSSRQRRAIAFQGNIRDRSGKTITEVFVADLPDKLPGIADEQYLQGTINSRPPVPEGVTQRRVTYMENGIEGPRHWLRSTPDGSLILFLAKDTAGIVQLFAVSPNGGTRRQITQQAFPIQGPFNINPQGNLVAYPADNSIFITDITSGKTFRATANFRGEGKIAGAPNWSPDGKSIAYNRYVKQEEGIFLQIFLLKIVED